jgi:hypothetical protein
MDFPEYILQREALHWLHLHDVCTWDKWDSPDIPNN